MKEKEILKETVKEDKKRYYKPKKKKEIIEKPTSEVEEFVMRASEIPNMIKLHKQVGSYKIGKSFHVFFEKKPNSVHRFFTNLFLGWKWVDNT